MFCAKSIKPGIASGGGDFDDGKKFSVFAAKVKERSNSMFTLAQ